MEEEKKTVEETQFVPDEAGFDSDDNQEKKVIVKKLEPEKEQAIKEKLRSAFDSFLESIEDAEIRQLFKEYGFIAGGAIASCVTDDEPKDYDIYLKDKKACYSITEYLLDQMGEESLVNRLTFESNGLSLWVPGGIIRLPKNGEKYQPFIVTANAFSFTDGVQVIIRFADSTDKIVGNFDFLHAKGVYDYKEDALIIPDEVMLALKQKRITYTGSKYPLASMIRTRKFMRRGWNVNAGQFLKMSIQISQLDLTDPKVLREQLVGVDMLYFAGFLAELEKEKLGDISKLELEKRFEFLFNKIDDAFKKNDEEGNKDEENGL